MAWKIPKALVVAVVVAWPLAGCSGSSPDNDAGPSDAGIDAGVDAGHLDAGPDAGIDAGVDAGTLDAGPDAGTDAGPLDAGPDDAGFDAGELPFASELQAAAQSPSLYSMSFGEESPFLVVFFPVLETPLACSLDSLRSAENAPWILEIATPFAPGTYPVGPSNSYSFPPPSDQSIAILVATQQSTTVQPTEGQIVISEAPAGPADQVGGTHLTGSFHLGFQADPLQPPDCYGGGQALPDGGFVETDHWCICKDVGGNVVSVCDGGEPDSECCLSNVPATVTVDGTFDSPPCYLLCADAQTGQCQQLVTDGG